MNRQQVFRLRLEAVCTLAALLSCANDPDTAPEGSTPDTTPGVDSTTPGAGAPPPEPGPNEFTQLSNVPASCLLAGMDDAERQANFAFIAYHYLRGLETQCWRLLLNGALTVEQQLDWGNYLFNYTSAVFGCGLVFEPLPGGVDAFALINTDVVGVPGPSLSPADAATLIDRYIGACAAQLAASPAVLQPIRAHLERAAESRIVTSATTWLSDCPLPASEMEPPQ